jgi:LPS-assembly protein
MRFRGPDNNNAHESENIETRTTTRSTMKIRMASALVLLSVGNVAWGVQPMCVPDVISRPEPVEPGPDGPAIELEGDQVESVGEDTVTLRGNATMRRGAQAVDADELTYYRNTGELEGKGDLTLYSEEGDRIEADHLRMHVETRVGEADNVKYRLAHRDREHKDPDTNTLVRARGTAAKAYMEGHDVTRMEGVTYTTCNEGDDAVVMSAKEITLDTGTGRGVAKNMTVKFKNVPIFYFPRVSFPIGDERKTGFLFPSIGAQEGSGFVMATPFYWNLAPNYDLTLYPRLYTQRGVQLGAEFRYLTESSRGSLYGEYLPQDSEFNDDDRGAFHLDHETDFTDRISGAVDAQYVSDTDYLDDFSNDIEISSATTLPQEARLNYNGSIWDLEARFFAYQVIDDNIPARFEPYDRLPQLTAEAEYDDLPYDIELEFEGEAVNFSQGELEDGWRLDATPSVKREFENVWGYVEPKLSLRHTSYFLNDRMAGLDENLNRTLPVFSMDSGIFLERSTSYRGRPFIHTLEPRLFYLYIPEKNQDEFPNFDTGQLNLNNFNNMFREYRFFGADRVGDTNQITAGLTSRLLDNETGNEWISGSIGMIFFLEDREVNLRPDEGLDDSTSDFLTEYNARLSDRWRSYGFLQWDTQEKEIREGKFDLSFEMEPRRYVDLSYRFSQNSTEQVRIDSVWRVLPRWHVLFEDRYSLRDSQNLETSVGLEYDGCCWRIRGYFQRRAESNDTHRNAIIFEFELTGLASIRAGV